MKNSFLNLLLVSFVSFSLIFLQSCGKDEDDAGAIDVLLGTWTATSADFTFTVNGVDFVTWIIDTFELTQEEAAEFLTLFEAGFEGEFVGTLKFNKDNTFTSNFDGESGTGKWSRNGNTLTLTELDGSDPFELKIVTLTANSLVLEFEEEEIEDIDEDGVNEVLKIVIRLNLSK